MMKLLSYLALACFTCPVLALAQEKGGKDEGPVGIFDSRDEYSQFLGSAKRTAYGEDGTPELRAMIPLLNDIALNRPVGSTSQQFSGAASLMGLIGNPRVRADLEIVDEQFEEFQRKAAESQQAAAEQLRGFDFSDRKGLVRLIEKIQDQTRQELESVLLPHQMDRLKQIRAQTLFRNRSFVEVLTSEPMRSELDISNRQADSLREEEQKIEADLQKEIAALRDKARQRLIKTLDRSQQEKIDDLIGDTFEFQPPTRAKAAGGKRAGSSKGGYFKGKSGKGGK
ncbi:MAG: hypothetical protein MK106_12495 [Mariniblastus sp.]|nr:hypothetical protein [Mariniblastus sp.]